MLLSLATFGVTAYLSLNVLFSEEKENARLSVCIVRIITWATSCVSAVIAVDEYYSTSFQLMGYSTQKSFVEPWNALTLSEFWGRRWF
jgi:hypothetical protein